MRRSPEHGSDNLGAEGSLSLFDLASEEISFLDRSMNCCIGFVDMVNSTKVTAEISDHRKVGVATSTSSKGREDLFGSTMNICAKINSMAEPNGIVIGGDLYQIIKSFSFIDKYYQFKELRGGYSIGFTHRYPIYCVLSKNNNDISEIAINSVNELFTSKRTSTIKDIQTKQRQPPSQLLQQNQQKQQQQKYSANIMVVDDEPDTVFTYKHILSAEGYNVEAFTDPQEALKRFVQLPDPSSYYQLVLLDIRMPRLNGLQLFYRIKAVSPATRIMFVSALDIAEELTSILPDIKYDDIIKKPLKREYFISKINSVLNPRPVHFESLGA